MPAFLFPDEHQMCGGRGGLFVHWPDRNKDNAHTTYWAPNVNCISQQHKNSAETRGGASKNTFANIRHETLRPTRPYSSQKRRMLSGCRTQKQTTCRQQWWPHRTQRSRARPGLRANRSAPRTNPTLYRSLPSKKEEKEVWCAPNNEGVSCRQYPFPSPQTNHKSNTKALNSNAMQCNVMQYNAM